MTPYKSNKICSHINCHVIIKGTETRCSAHQHKSWEIKRAYDPFYSSSKWKRLSKTFRTKHPLCIQCKKKGRDTIAKHTDHIIPIDKGGAPLDWKNLNSLCIPCHSSKTAKEIRNK